MQARGDKKEGARCHFSFSAIFTASQADAFTHGHSHAFSSWQQATHFQHTPRRRDMPRRRRDVGLLDGAFSHIDARHTHLFTVNILRRQFLYAPIFHIAADAFFCKHLSILLIYIVRRPHERDDSARVTARQPASPPQPAA